MTSPLPKMKKAAIEAAQDAGKILMKYFRQPKKLNIRHKEKAGLVTQADLQAEEKVIRRLSKAFPHFSVLAEESGGDATPDPQGKWIIDPLDGTTNFAHGYPMFCVSIGAELHGELVLGVIFHPLLNEMYVGIKGKGATLNGKRIHVSRVNRMANALVATGFAYTTHELHRDMQTFERVSQSVQAVRRPGSAALDLAYTARGVFDGFWERNLNSWDMAAGAVLVAEAGGRVSDFGGKTFDVYRPEILATNASLASALLEQIQGQQSS